MKMKQPLNGHSLQLTNDSCSTNCRRKKRVKKSNKKK